MDASLQLPGAGLPAHEPHMIAALLQQSLDVKFGANKCIVTPRWQGPQYDAYSCILAHGIRPEQIELMARALALAAQASSCRISQADDALLLEIPKPEPLRQVLRAERFETFVSSNPTSVPIGLTTGGKMLWLNIADERQAHVLVGGLSGSGKSVLLKWILYRLLAQNLPDKLAVIGCDPKISNAEGLRPFTHAAHLLHPIQRHVFEVVRLLTWVLCEIERREALSVTSPRLLLVIEEVAHYTDQSQQVAPLLKEIMQVGRGWGINVIATMQKPEAKALGGAIANFGVTLSGRVARGTQVYGTTGRKGTDADELLMRGDMLYLGAGETIRFQAPFADGRQWLRIKRGGPASLDAQLPRADLINTGAWKGGSLGRIITPADIERVRPLVQAGRGVDAVRQALGIGTDRARTLHMQIKQGDV